MVTTGITVISEIVVTVAITQTTVIMEIPATIEKT